MKKTLLLTAVLAIATMAFAQTPVYLDNSKPINDRVEDALSRMTLQEKINMVHAVPTALTESVPRCCGMSGIRQDGPMTPSPLFLL